jgi:thymidylate kinase
VFTVALIGPDGSGKSTIARELEKRLPMPASYVYMGVNLESSNLVLPTTRIALEIKRLLGGRPDMTGPPDPARQKPPPKNPVKRLFKEAKSLFRMLNLIAEEWYRQIVVSRLLARGRLVLCDRHFFPEYWEHDIANRDPKRSFARKLHGAVLRRFPRPDLVVCLDAPSEVLHARKGEGTLESLEGRRRQYLAMEGVVEHFARVDVSKPLPEVLEEVTRVITEFWELRRAEGTEPVRRVVETTTGAR